MSLTKKQLIDIESIKFFIPKMFKEIDITEEDMIAFQRLSTHGEGDKSLMDMSVNGFNALKQGKKMRGLNMRMWEESVLEGTIPYCDILNGLPRVVVDFMKREMFKGMDADLIEKVYLEVEKESEE